MIIVLLLCGGIVFAACDDTTGDSNRERAAKTRENNMEKAESKLPAPKPQNFPQRQALIEMTLRQDMLNHPWYIYLLNMQGEYIGYYVGKTYPISTCNFLSSSEIVDSSSEGKVILTAPSLDGMFYGGGGSSAACQSMFFFDVTTDAMVTFSIQNWFATDSPLAVDVPRITVSKDADTSGIGDTPPPLDENGNPSTPGPTTIP